MYSLRRRLSDCGLAAQPGQGAEDCGEYREATGAPGKWEKLGRQDSGGLSFRPYFEQTCAKE